MKKTMLFAVILGVATLMIFSSCKKDELSKIEDPEISFQISREGVLGYSDGNTGDSVIRFAITGKLSTDQDIYIPKKQNYNILAQGVTTSASVKNILQGDFRLDYLETRADDFYYLTAGQEIEFVYWVDVTDLQDLQLYQVRLNKFLYTSKLDGELKEKSIGNVYLEYYHQE